MLFKLKHPLASPASNEGGIEAGSPTALATDVEPAESSTVVDEGQPADTSTATATEDENEPSFFDAISEAADPKSDEDKDAESKKDEDADADGEAKAEGDDADKTKAEDSEGEGEDEKWEENVPFHKHPRWQQMVRERNEYRDQLQDFQQPAEQFRQIETFMESQGLNNQEVAQGFQIMALMKNDPAGALEALRGHIEGLEGFVGEKLPGDLQEEVDEGFITSDRAREIARLRNTSQFQADRAAEQEDRRAKDSQQQQRQQAQQKQRTAVDTWQQDITNRDADFKTKQPFVFRELALLAQQSPPRNEQEAVSLAQRAYDNVNAQMKNLTGRKPEIKPSINSDRAGANSGAGPEPSSFLEAVRQAADSAR